MTGDMGHIWRVLLLSAVLFFLPMMVVLAITLMLKDVFLEAGGAIVLRAISVVIPGSVGMGGILAKNVEATGVILCAAAILPPKLGPMRPGPLAVQAVLAGNGGVVGVVVGGASLLSGVSAWTLFVTGIAPHGILEVPALLLTAVMSWELVRLKRHKGCSWGMPLSAMMPTMRLYGLIVLPLLAGAAYIEANYTEQLIRLVLVHLA